MRDLRAGTQLARPSTRFPSTFLRARYAHDMPCRVWLLVVLLIAHMISFLSPANRSDWMLEQIPSALAIGFLAWYERRPGGQPLSGLSYTLIFIFMLMHLVGAHYLYSHVPYDDWSQAILGISITESLGADRNHYDRLVHFLFGLMMTVPMLEVVRRHVLPRPGWSIAIAVVFIGFLSKVYELGEWFVAVVASPETAENYNGQQGDIFDAHKDMALALFGSILTATMIAIRQRRPR